MREPGGATAPAPAASEVPYKGISPSTATTVEEELNYRARAIGGEDVVNSWEDLEFHYKNVSGVHNVTGTVRQTGFVNLPLGHEIDLGVTGRWLTNIASTKVVGNSTGAVFTGNPLVLDGVGVEQLNPAGTMVDASSTSGDLSKNIVIRNCVLTGPGGVGAVSNSLAALNFDNSQIIGAASGLVLKGTIALVRILDVVGVNLATGAKLFILDETANVVGGIQWTGCIMVTSDSGQQMIRIDPSATIPGNDTGLTSLVGIRATNCSIVAVSSDELGEIFDKTGIDAIDQRVWARENLYGRQSVMLGQCQFLVEDILPVPITKTYTDINTFENIPRSNGGSGPGNEILLDVVSQRFALITPDEVAETSVFSGGSYASDGAGLTATQASTSGAGVGAEFTVTVAGGTVTTIDSTVDPGLGYAEGDTITLAIAGEIVAAVITVETIEEWYMRVNGALPADRLIIWTATIQTTSGSSTIKARAEWRQGSGDAWKPVPATTNPRIQANNVPGFFAGVGNVPSNDEDSHFKVTFANDNAAVDTKIVALTMNVS